ncbi:hypothetical protein [Anaeromyxobacter paludicola]|uniref:Uncharacterized protein n=1 Tax=Anaeromyxobacter paludicola TaxID=2918171 RepID=A0ABM7X700_9BACT|nr:hypothetical protein [Anaeromyxobacter paludicola]BDG07615.1 hypothetical protein AMPC_07280 [Anaeromyxobacter paludicola]
MISEAATPQRSLFPVRPVRAPRREEPERTGPKERQVYAWNAYAAEELEHRETLEAMEMRAVARATEAAELASGFEPAWAARDAFDAGTGFLGRARAVPRDRLENRLARWARPRVVTDRMASDCSDPDCGREVGAKARRIQKAPKWNPEAFADVASLISKARKSAQRCETTQLAVKCLCGIKLVTKGCERRDCVYCAPVVSRDSGERMAEKILASIDDARSRSPRGANASLWSVKRAVLTVPPEHRAQFMDPERVREVRRNLWKFLQHGSTLNAAWACVVVHPVGDEDPTEFSPHFNVFWMERAAHASAWRRGHVPRGMLTEGELERLREAWAQIIGAEYRERCSPDVWVQFDTRDNEAAIFEHATYMARVFAGWSGWNAKWIQWFGDFFKRLEPPPKVCPKCGAQHSIVADGADAAELYERLAAAQQSAAGPPEEPPA